MDCSPTGSFVHGILQVRILEWVAISFSWGSSQPRGRTQVSCIAGRFFAAWPPGKPTWGERVQIISWIFDSIFYPVLLCLKPPCRGRSVIRNGMSLRVTLGPAWNMTLLSSVHVNKCLWVLTLLSPWLNPCSHYRASQYPSGLPRCLSGKESAYPCGRSRRLGFHPSVETIFQRRAWQPTPVFLPGKSCGQRSLAGYSPWSHKYWTQLSD